MRITVALLASYFFLLASTLSVFAQTLDYPYPNPEALQLQIPIDACKPEFINWINTAQPVCLSKPSLAPEVQGTQDLIEQIRHSDGSGEVTIDAEKLANFAHSYTNTTQDMLGTFKARPATSYWDLNNPTGFNSTCLRSGYTMNTLDDCAVAIGRTNPHPNGQTSRNLLATSTVLDRYFSDQSLFEEYFKPRIEDIVACCDGAPVAPSGLPCEGQDGFQMGPNSSDTSCYYARRCPTTNYSDWLALSSSASPTDRQLAFECHSFPPNLFSSLVVPVIIPNIQDWANATQGNFIRNFLNYFGMLIDWPQEAYGRINLPGLHGTTNISRSFYLASNTAQNGQAGLARVQALISPSHFSLANSDCEAAAKRMIKQRIDEANTDCGPPKSKLKQLMGSVCPNCGQTSSFNWQFNLGDVLAAMNDHVEPYEIWFLLPQELLANKAFVGADPDAIINGFLALGYQSQLDDLDNPLPIDNQPGSAQISEEVPTGETTYEPCSEGSPNRTPEGTCPQNVTTTASINWASRDTLGDEIGLPGGEPNYGRSLLGNRFALSKYDPEHHPDSCYYPRIAAALPGAMGALVGTLANNFSSSFCPDLALNSRSNTGLIKSDYTCPIETPESWFLDYPPPIPPSDYSRFFYWLDTAYPNDSHRNTNQLPLNEAVGCLIQWMGEYRPGSHFDSQHITQVISWAQANGWSPSLLMSLWLEESLAGYRGDTKEFGCGHAESNVATDFDSQLTCMNDMNQYLPQTFTRFMCIFAGDCPLEWHMGNDSANTNQYFPGVIQFYNFLTQWSP